MRHLRRRLAVATGIGITGGLVAAVVIPNAESTPATPPFAAASKPLTTAPALATTTDDYGGEPLYLRAHRSTVRIEARRADPAGGPGWAVRVFEADRMIPVKQRRPHTDGVASVGLCAQLGREVDGRFGWIDGDNVFRPVSTRTLVDLPATCGSRRLDRRHEPVLKSSLLVDAPTSRAPTVRGSVIWGLTGATADAAVLTAAGHRSTPPRSARWGAFLEFAGPSQRPVAPRLQVRYVDGKTFDTDHASGSAGFPVPRGYAPDAGDAIVPSATRVIARAADPAGGPSWAVVGLRTKKGLWCLGSTGYLIDGHVGYVEPKLGTMMEDAYAPNGCGSRAQPTAEYPVQAMSSSGTSTDHPLLAPDASKLRMQRGRTIISGRTLDSIDSLTIATPRDVRTIEVTDPGHGFIVVYDGTFPGGKLEATAHFEDGHTKTVSLPGAGM